MLATAYGRWRLACWLGVALGAAGILFGDRLVLALGPAGLALAGCGAVALRRPALREEINERASASAAWRWRFGRFQAGLLLAVGLLWALLGFAEGLS